MEYLRSWSTILIVIILEILSELETFMFLMYFLMILRSELDATLLVIIEKPLLSAQMKFAMTSDLISLSAILIFAMCLLNKTMILVALSELIRTKTCLSDKPFVVILILSLLIFNSFMIFWTFSIFLNDRFRKLFLIFIISLISLIETWVYDQLFIFFCLLFCFPLFL